MAKKDNRVIDNMVVGRTGEFRVIEERRGWLFRKVVTWQERVLVQPWDTNTGQDVGPETSAWVDVDTPDGYPPPSSDLAVIHWHNCADDSRGYGKPVPISQARDIMADGACLHPTLEFAAVSRHGWIPGYGPLLTSARALPAPTP